MKLFLFVGPTISEQTIAESWQGLEYSIFPPAKQGDIYLACKENPQAIGIVDGFFETVPSVWHKEILWAMKQGIHVYGASSIGALRAAELVDYGMEGVGKIFQDFNNNELEDDDEVTVIHASKENGYLSHSEAMVNIRATLKAAEQRGIIDSETKQQLEYNAKQLHYSERNYDNILHGKNLAGSQILSNKDLLEKMQVFFTEHAVNQKQQDAQELLEKMKVDFHHGLKRKQTDFVFQYTDNWQQMLDGLIHKSIFCSEDNEQIISSLAEQGESYYQNIKNAARFRSLAIKESYRQGVSINAQMLSEAKYRFCQDHDFIRNQEIDIEGIQCWLEQQQYDLPEFDAMIQDEARFHWYCRLTQSLEVCEIKDYLKISGLCHKTVL